MHRFYNEVFEGILITFIFILVLGYIINFIVGVGWLFFIFKSILFTMTYVILMYCLRAIFESTDNGKGKQNNLFRLN